jgi:hypothetical protein
MIVVLAAGLLLVAVVLLVLRPLLAPPAAPPAAPGAQTDTAAELDALERTIAERRARMAAREVIPR